MRIGRLRSAGAALALLLLLAMITLLALRDPELAAVIAIFTATLSQALITTLGNYTAGFQLSSESVIHEGCLLVTIGPDGPFTGKVVSRELRTTLLRNQAGDQSLVVPNAMLTAGPVKILDAWPAPAVPP